MIHLLPRSRYGRVERLFAGPKRHVPALAVLQERFPGRVYVDDLEVPGTALVWALTRWAYVAGEPTCADFMGGLAELIGGEIAGVSHELGMSWFELYASPTAPWMSALAACLAPLAPSRHHENTFVLDPAAYRRARREPVVPAGMELEHASFPLVPAAAWSSPHVSPEMARRTSFGCRLVAGDRVVATCRSNGFTAGREFMIDVETHAESDRGRGYASLVSTALLDYALDRELMPLWETTEDNHASRRLARKLGFVEGEPYPVYAMSLGERPATGRSGGSC